MPSLTLDRFDGGLDLRQAAAVQSANRLVEGQNVYVTTGWKVRKRPGLKVPTVLEPGTVGLVPYDGKLNTFYHNATSPVVHANPLYQSHLVRYPGSSPHTIAKIHNALVFNGFIYLAAEFANGEVYHYYLDEDPTWAATTAYSLGNFVEPITPNGLRYQCTTAGTSGGSQPSFPTTPGVTVADGSVVWTTRAKNVLDANCPNHKSIVKGASKIFSPGTEVVRFCATNAARDWTTSSDAGFLPTGVSASGDPVAQAVSRYREQLLVAMIDGIQLWDIDPDPSLMAVDESLDIGTDKYRSFAIVAGDTYFLTPFGVRSVADLEVSQTIEDIDIGAPIDPLVLADKAAGNLPDDVEGLFFNGGGQYLAFAKRSSTTRAYVFSHSRISKLSAWTHYDWGFVISDVAELNNVLYVRSGDNVYEVSHDVKADNGITFPTRARLPFLSAKKPGQLKQLIGLDVVMAGRANVSILFDSNDLTKATTPIELSGDTRPGGLIPIEGAATEPAILFESDHDEDWRLDLLTLYYDLLGVTSP